MTQLLLKAALGAEDSGLKLRSCVKKRIRDEVRGKQSGDSLPWRRNATWAAFKSVLHVVGALRDGGVRAYKAFLTTLQAFVLDSALAELQALPGTFGIEYRAERARQLEEAGMLPCEGSLVEGCTKLLRRAQKLRAVPDRYAAGAREDESLEELLLGGHSLTGSAAASPAGPVAPAASSGTFSANCEVAVKKVVKRVLDFAHARRSVRDRLKKPAVVDLSEADVARDLAHSMPHGGAALVDGIKECGLTPRVTETVEPPAGEARFRGEHSAAEDFVDEAGCLEVDCQELTTALTGPFEGADASLKGLHALMDADACVRRMWLFFCQFEDCVEYFDCETITMLPFLAAYMKLAKDFFDKDPRATGQAILTSFTLLALIDRFACYQHPEVREASLGVDPTCLTCLWLPGAEARKQLASVEKYLLTRKAGGVHAVTSVQFAAR